MSPVGLVCHVVLCQATFTNSHACLSFASLVYYLFQNLSTFCRSSKFKRYTLTATMANDDDQDEQKVYTLHIFGQEFYSFDFAEVKNMLDFREKVLAFRRTKDYGNFLRKWQDYSILLAPSLSAVPLQAINGLAVVQKLIGDYLEETEKVLMPKKHRYTAKTLLDRAEKAKTAIEKLELTTLALIFVPEWDKDLLEKILKKKSELDNSSIKDDKLNNRSDEKPKPKTIGKLSDKVEVRYSPTKGRHLVAKVALEPGEAVVDEMPYAFVLLPHRELESCHHCMFEVVSSNNIPLSPTVTPCHRCIEVLYCSEACRLASWNEYHRYECGFLVLFWNLGIGHLSYRILVSTPPEKLAKYTDHDLRWPRKAVETLDVDLDAFEAVWSLVEHMHTQTRESLTAFAITTALIIRVLEKVLFPFKSPQRLAGLIMVLIHQVIPNGHAISILGSLGNPANFKDRDFETLQNISLGTGLYPAVAMLNHACRPNTLATFSGIRHVIRVAEPIAAGEEVLNCYGPLFTKRDYTRRQKLLLAQYNFECKCRQCEFEKPRLDILKRITGGSKFDMLPAFVHCGQAVEIEGGNFVCSKCKHKFSTQEVKAILSQLKLEQDLMSKELWESLDSPQIIDRMRRFQTSLGKLIDVWQVHFYGCYCDFVARKCFQHRSIDQACEALERSLKVVRTLYGPHSVQYTLELLKMADIWDAFGGEVGKKELRADRNGLRKLLEQFRFEDSDRPDYFDEAIKQLDEMQK